MDLDIFINKVNKSYQHIDYPLSKKEARNFLNSIYDWRNIKQHRFLPFISFEITFKKHPNKQKKHNVKNRKIELASHHDAGIYAYLAEKLNEAYDAYVEKANITEVAVAYRKNKGNSNITSAKEVLDFIDENEETWVMKGDFKGFFDNLNHFILNKNLLQVLNLDLKSMEGRAWSAVIKKIEKYDWMDKNKLIDRMKMNGMKAENKQGAYFNSLKEYGQFIQLNRDLLHKNKKIGIPQGTSISAVLANVYMIVFDELVYNLISDFGGMYRRYSDDFIVIIPKNRMCESKFKKIAATIIEKSNSEIKLTIERNKTKLLNIHQGKVENLNTKKETSLDYLGFALQNNTVSIRSKSIYKFNYRGKKSVKATLSAENMYFFLQNFKKNLETIDDHSAWLIYDQYARKSGRQLLEDMNEKKAEANVHRMKRVMYYYNASKGLPEHNKTINGYLRTIDSARARESFLSYVNSVNKVFSKNKVGYKTSFNKQTNKVRNRLNNIKNKAM